MKYHQLLESKHGSNFKGYTLEEISYMRAYTTARIEMQKGQMAQQYKNFMETGSLTGGSTWVRRLFKSLSYFDYAIIAFKIFTSVGKLRRIRR